jgi:hypothetical protein
MPKSSSLLQPHPKSVSPLKAARVLAGLRQHQVASPLGHGASWLSVREAGIVPVSPQDAIRLSRILRTPIEILFPARDAG